MCHYNNSFTKLINLLMIVRFGPNSDGQLLKLTACFRGLTCHLALVSFMFPAQLHFMSKFTKKLATYG